MFTFIFHAKSLDSSVDLHHSSVHTGRVPTAQYPLQARACVSDRAARFTSVLLRERMCEWRLFTVVK